MSRKKSSLTPRNGHVAVMRTRPSGPHGKSRKAERRADKVRLEREKQES